jgi:hypothetical protein
VADEVEPSRFDRAVIEAARAGVRVNDARTLRMHPLARLTLQREAPLLLTPPAAPPVELVVDPALPEGAWYLEDTSGGRLVEGELRPVEHRG